MKTSQESEKCRENKKQETSSNLNVLMENQCGKPNQYKSWMNPSPKENYLFPSKSEKQNRQSQSFFLDSMTTANQEIKDVRKIFSNFHFCFSEKNF